MYHKSKPCTMNSGLSHLKVTLSKTCTMKAGPYSITTQTIFDILTFAITIFCLGFVIYKGQECLVKFLDKPKSTDVSIQHAYKYPYPAITICHNDFYEIYEKRLTECNSTFWQYFDNYQWMDNSSDFCSDPEKLFKKVTGNLFDIVTELQIATPEAEITLSNEDFHFKDDRWHGRCFTFEVQPNAKMIGFYATFHRDAYIFVHTPGSFFGSDYKEFLVRNDSHIRMDVMHEIFKVLDFDGESCKDYVFGRDECIHSAIDKSSIDKIGCTTPYGLDKSNICTNPFKGKLAEDLMNDLLYNNLTEANQKCPKTCTYMMTSFGSTFSDASSDKSLELRFQAFIKVSKSRVSYGWLELLAEFGGYVGLFLGVSINQIFSLSKITFEKIQAFI